MTLEELFTNIANAIRNKKQTTGQILATNFANEILSIFTGDEIPSEMTLLFAGSYGQMTEEVCDKLFNGTYEVEN